VGWGIKGVQGDTIVTLPGSGLIGLPNDGTYIVTVTVPTRSNFDFSTEWCDLNISLFGDTNNQNTVLSSARAGHYMEIETQGTTNRSSWPISFISSVDVSGAGGAFMLRVRCVIIDANAPTQNDSFQVASGNTNGQGVMVRIEKIG